jgi:hypothetical protein
LAPIISGRGRPARAQSPDDCSRRRGPPPITIIEVTDNARFCDGIGAGTVTVQAAIHECRVIVYRWRRHRARTPSQHLDTFRMVNLVAERVRGVDRRSPEAAVAKPCGADAAGGRGRYALRSVKVKQGAGARGGGSGARGGPGRVPSVRRRPASACPAQSTVQLCHVRHCAVAAVAGATAPARDGPVPPISMSPQPRGPHIVHGRGARPSYWTDSRRE